MHSTTLTAPPETPAATQAATQAATDRLTAVRRELPAVTAGGYFNTGYTGPLCGPAARAAARVAAGEYELGRMGTRARAVTAAVLADARERVAGLLGARPADIALTHHTTEGMNLVAHGLPWRPGDNAVTTRTEHKGGLLPLGVLRRRRQVELRAVPWQPGESPTDTGWRVAEAIDAHTRLVAISHVSYATGAVADLEPVLAAAHRHGALVVVDGAQAAGTIPVDVTALGVDAYAISGQKWLCGPDGTGALYVHPDALDRVEPTYVGWASVDTWDLDGTFAPNADASRFEVGTRSVSQLAGFAAAIGWRSDEVGLPWAAARTRELAALAGRLLHERAGARILTPAEHAGLVSFRTALPPDTLVQRLADRGITVRSIFGYDCVRASVGFFHTEDEVVRLVDAVLEAGR